MSFDKPLCLFLLFLLVPMIAAFFLRIKKRNRGADFMAVSAPSGEKVNTRRRIMSRITLSDIFFFLFTAFIIIALSGPRWGTELTPDNRRGLDLVLAFDISRSMNARDCPDPAGAADISRLQQALSIAKELCSRFNGVRFATAAGKGNGILMVPLTWDSEAVLDFLDSLDDSFLTGSGTNLQSLLDASVGAFRDNMNRRKGIILFTDGEALQGSLQSSLDSAGAAGIVISTVGLGSADGERIPVEKTPDTPGGFLLAPDGTEVISYRQDDILQDIAKRSGGIYTDGNQGSSAVQDLAGFYSSFSAASPTTFRRESAARWPIFVFAGIVCFGLSRLLGFRKRKAASAVIVVSLLFSSCSFFNGKLLVMEGNYYNSVQKYDDAIASYLKAAEIGGSSPYAEYGLGYSYHALDENEAALQQYAAAEKNLDNASGDHQELRYRLNFNTGIIYFEQGDFGGASDSFRKALEIDGSRLDAKKNLELSLLAQSRQNKNEGNAAALADAAGERQTQNSGSGAGESDDQRVRALYDYLRQKEQEQWRNEWTGDSNPVWPDY